MYSKSSVPLSFNLKWLKSKIYEITNVRKSEFARHSNLHNSAVMQATPLKLEVWLAPSKPDDHVYARMRKHWSEKMKASSRWLLCKRAVLSSGGRTERHLKVCLMFLPFTARSSLTTWISTSLHASIRHKPPFRARGYRFLRCRRPNRQHKENDADFFLPERYAKIRYNEAAFLMFRKLTQMIAAQFNLRRFKIIVANPLTAMAESRMNLSQRFKVKFHIRQVEIN